MKAFCEGARTAWAALGQVDYGRKASEQGNVKFRRSLYFVNDMKKGDLIKQGDIRSVRPGYGLAPKYLEAILGKCLSVDVNKNTAVSWSTIVG